jgi:Rrf2 family nitric oxide-sensitive transcriptional repressor
MISHARFMMRLTDRTDFALRVLMVLASRRERRTVPELSACLNAPLNHLVKVVQILQRENWVSTTRGRSGGVDLVVDPRRLRIGEVVRRVESRFDLAECFREGSDCPLMPGCSLAAKLSDATDAFLAVLDEITLAEIVGTSSRAILRITA